MTNSNANKSVSMSEDFLKNPLSLFDIKGKTAIVTGATGAFGALAAQVLSGAGCNVVLAAGGADALKKVAADCEKLGAKVETVNIRPSSAANCDKIVEAAVKRFGGDEHFEFTGRVIVLRARAVCP